MEAWSAVMAVLLVYVCRSASAEYENFTVGDKEGWTAKPSVSYAKWASDKNFSLGDYLIFNFTNADYDVIQTYNQTVYTDCDYMNSDGDFEVWGESATTMVATIPLVMGFRHLSQYRRQHPAMRLLHRHHRVLMGVMVMDTTTMMIVVLLTCILLHHTSYWRF
ncbi:hypothetical protein GOP47_0019761 [Adiantum capillus-veneris]|uniref:Phytocyanin domain-containing protein n=1 Tax=Adiantum capillus-veneris TaxID=13818 RepID=A0A9D4Z9Y0_ADICA|nr:hypothetical protein GOP47_0019761 [Adiantum capillus-veneris]